MVSIHRILIVLYMTIRVLCFVFRFKRGNIEYYQVEALDCLAQIINNAHARYVYSSPYRGEYITLT